MTPVPIPLNAAAKSVLPRLIPVPLKSLPNFPFEFPSFLRSASPPTTRLPRSHRLLTVTAALYHPQGPG